ncbi:MAG: enoyl-CoA hydratase/isomerase family protein [Sphingobium sp.]
MGENRFRFERDGGLATITLCRPEAGNALDDAAGREIREIAVECVRNADIRAVLMLSEGKNFCVGGDLGHVGKQADPGGAIREMTVDFHAAMLLFSQMDAPLITGVQGAATGAGLSLTAVSDYVVAARSSLFAYAYTGIGLTSDGGLTWTLPRLIGLRNFQSLYLTGRRVSAEEALTLGIVSEVADDEAYADRARALATQIAQGPTRAFGAIKRLTSATFDHGFAAQLEAESQAIMQVARTDDVRGAIEALFAKRKPVFNGR